MTLGRFLVIVFIFMKRKRKKKNNNKKDEKKGIELGIVYEKRTRSALQFK